MTTGPESGGGVPVGLGWICTALATAALEPKTRISRRIPRQPGQKLRRGEMYPTE